MNAASKTMRAKKIIYGILIFILLSIAGAALYLNSLMPIITGYAAKNLCSAVFISGRQQEAVESLDLDFSFISFVNSKIDTMEKTVTSRFLWGKSTALYRKGFGATLIQEKDIEELKNQNFPAITIPYDKDTLDWPLGDKIPAVPDDGFSEALDDLSRKLITENGYGGYPFAFMVLYKGIPVAEAYKPEFSKDTPFLSWSMAKSITSALVGIMVEKEQLNLLEDKLLPAWSGDNRSAISLNNLLHMQSGLEWNEDYGNRSDVTLMLHCEPGFAQYAYNKPLEHEPGTHWYYSSGTTNIVSYIMRRRFDNDSAYYTFPHTEFFHKTGITGAVFETDESGTFVASSYLYMTARDYARFGLLYLQDGMFAGERILPVGWVDYTSSPASDSGGAYGSFFWLNMDGSMPGAPGGMYMCQGHDGQRIFIIPSQDLVVVILGYSPKPDNTIDFNLVLADIVGIAEKNLH